MNTFPIQIQCRPERGLSGRQSFRIESVTGGLCGKLHTHEEWTTVAVDEEQRARGVCLFQGGIQLGRAGDRRAADLHDHVTDLEPGPGSGAVGLKRGNDCPIDCVVEPECLTPQSMRSEEHTSELQSR